MIGWLLLRLTLFFLLLLAFTFNLRGVERPLSEPVLGRAPGLQQLPRAAGNEHGSLVVWNDSRGNGDVYGTRLDEDGRAIDPTGLRIATGYGMTDVAATSSGSMVVVNRDCAAIELVHVDRDGVATEPRAIGTSAPHCAEDAVIETIGDISLVAWRPGHAALVNPQRDVITAFPFPENAERIAVASNGEGFLLAAAVRRGSTLDLIVAPVAINGLLGMWTRVQTIEGVADIALASSGSEYLLVTGGAALRAQPLRSDGTPLTEPTIAATSEPARVPRVAWAGGAYVVAFAMYDPPQRFTLSILELDRAGKIVNSRSDIVAVAQNLTPSNFDLWSSASGELLLTFGDDGDVYTTRALTPSASPSLLSVAASHEQGAQIARTRGGYVALWQDYSPDHGSTLRAVALTDDLLPRGEALDLGSIQPGAAYLIQATDDAVLMIWKDRYHGGPLFLRRFLPDLMPIDSAPLVVTTDAYELAVAAGTDQALIVWTSYAGTPPGFYGDLYGSTISMTTPLAPSSTVTIATLPLHDHAPAVAWDGKEFAVFWAHALGHPPSQGLFPDPPDELLAVRISSEGAVIDSLRQVSTGQGAIGYVGAASNGRDFEVIWLSRDGVAAKAFSFSGPTDPGDRSLVSTPGRPVQAATIIAIGRRYLIAWVMREAPHVEHVQWRWIEGDVVGPIISLLPREVSYAARGVSFAAAGSSLVIVYDRLAHEPEFGGVSRVFLQTVPLNMRRRAARP